jgi:two-component system response regulator AtoC
MGSNGQQFSLDGGVEEILVNYDWPGNVRELENVIDRALILADGGRVTLADLPPQITKVNTQLSSVVNDLQFSGTLREQVRKFEAALIFRTIAECGGDRRIAAQKLNIGLSSLYRKLEELGESAPMPQDSHSPDEIPQE